MAILPVGAPVGAPGLAPISTPAAQAGTSFGAVLRARVPVQSSPASQPGRARAALAEVERSRQRLDAALAAARQGRTFTAQELLALQTDAYRYSQAFELASKAVEQGAQCVKQAVNTQV